MISAMVTTLLLTQVSMTMMIYSIANDYTSEDENTLAEKEDDLLAVCTRHPATNQSESAEDFLLAREAVVHFVQESIANAVDRQKRNADKDEEQTFFYLMLKTYFYCLR